MTAKMKLVCLSIADDFHQLCGSSYHILRRNVPMFVKVFANDGKNIDYYPFAMFFVNLKPKFDPTLPNEKPYT